MAALNLELDFDLDGDTLREDAACSGIFGHEDAAALTALACTLCSNRDRNGRHRLFMASASIRAPPRTGR